MNFDQLSIIVRECGENTKQILCDLVADQFPGSKLIVVQEQPFSKALRISLEKGKEVGRENVLCLDADVLPIADNLKNLIDEFNKLPAHVAEIQGLVYDNLFRTLRPAGNHLYRLRHLDRAIANIPHENEKALRPESKMLSSLLRGGRPWYQSRKIVGYHDFGQSPADVYRKAFLHCKKHSEFVTYLKELWLALSEEEAEFKVALKALEDSEIYVDDVTVGKAFMLENALDIEKRIAYKMIDDKQLVNFIEKPLHENMSDIPQRLIKARQRCQSKLNRKLFYSRGAMLRKTLTIKTLERILK